MAGGCVWNGYPSTFTFFTWLFWIALLWKCNDITKLVGGGGTIRGGKLDETRKEIRMSELVRMKWKWDRMDFEEPSVDLFPT